MIKKHKKGMDYRIHPQICYAKFTKLHHATHAWCTSHWHSGLLLGLVADDALCGQEHTCD